MTLLQLRYFREVAHTKHFTAAAENLHVAQPSLSYSIKELEKELGVPLFTRGANKKIDLTVYGVCFLTYAERALNALEEGRAALRQHNGDDPLSGTVRLGVYYCISLSMVPQLQQMFNDEYPNNNLTIETYIHHTHTNSEELLTKGVVDLFLSSTNNRSGCESVSVATQKSYVVLPVTHPLASHESLRMAELGSETFICADAESRLDHDVQAMIHTAGIKPRVQYCYDWSAQYSLVAQGRGIAITPKLPMNESIMRAVPLDDERSERTIYLSWASNRRLPSQVEFLRDYISDRAADGTGAFAY